MENETNLIVSTLDRVNACTMRACDEFEHTVPHARLLARRIQFRTVLQRAPATATAPLPLKAA